MADPHEIATDTAAQPERLAEEVIASYRNDLQSLPNGISQATRDRLSEYVKALAQAGMYGFSDFLFEGGRPVIRETILGSLDLGGSARPELVNAIDTHIAYLAFGHAVASFDPAQLNVMQAADPIDLFSGQFTQDVVDLALDGAGIEFAFRRSYRNQAVYFGPLGANWDHSYNLYLRRFGESLIRSSGELREDVYTRHPRFGETGFNYWMPPDGRHEIIEESGGSFVWRSPGGIRYVYVESADPTLHRIQRIEDRFANYLSFGYVDDRLQRVEVNYPRRFVEFEYGPDNHIAVLRDHTGRRWRFAYDDLGDLVAVTSPPTDRYPSGLTTQYEYSSDSVSPPLQHNLLRAIDPKGQLYVENEYGVNPGLLAFNRVIRQRQGSGESLFEYERVVSEFEFDYNPAERPAFQVNQTLRNGQMVHFVFNASGNLLLREEYVGGPGMDRLNRSRHRYNQDGALIGTLSAEGCLAQWYYGRDHYLRVKDLAEGDPTIYNDLTASERLAFGNLLATVRRGRPYDLAAMNLARGVWGDFFPDVLETTDARDIVVKQTYESDYQQLLSTSDPRFTARADPRFPESPDYDRHLTRYEYSTAPRRLLLAVRYPDCTFPSALPGGASGVVNASDEYLQYDARGRLERWRNAEGVISERRYFGGGPAAVTEGYLHESVLDPGGLALTTAFEVNDVGVVRSVTNPRGARTTFVINELNQTVESISPGPAFRIRSFYEENGLIARRERDNLGDGGVPSPEGDEVTTYRYDSQNNLIRESRGGADVGSHHVTRHCYDEGDRRVETILPRGNRIRFGFDERSLPTTITRGADTPLASTTRLLYDADGRAVGAADGRANVTRNRLDSFGRTMATTDALRNVLQSAYDKLGNVTVTRFFERRPDGTFALLHRQDFDYDERCNRIRETKWLFRSPIDTVDIERAPDAEFEIARAQGTATPVTSQFFYDRARRVFRALNAGEQEITYEYDQVGRRILERDNDGNYIQTSYDANSNVVRVDRHEQVRDPTTAAVLREDVFSTLHEYDDLDRRVATTDGLGNRTTFTYDSRGNVVSIIDPLGHKIRFVYDVFNRRIRETRETTDTGLGAGNRGPDVITRSVFDENDRLIATIDANGNTTAGEYDDLERLFRVTRADGSIERFRFDADDNIIERTDSNGLRILYTVDALKRRTAVDLDAGQLDPSFPYPADAETFERHVYDGLGRLVRQVSNACSVDAKFDSLGRAYEDQVAFTTPFPAPAGLLTLRRDFDLLSNRTDLQHPSGRSLRYEYDALNRVRLITNVSNGTGYPGSGALAAQYSVAGFQYRGLRLARAAFGNNAVSEWAYDGAGRIVSIRHQAANLDVEIQQLFDGAGNRRYEAEYPAAGAENARRFAFDSLHHVTVDRRTSIARVNPVPLEPPPAPLPPSALTGQRMIDLAIGTLETDAVNFTYRYDDLGNRLEERRPGRAPVVLIPNALNQIASMDGTLMRFDLNGNLIDDGERAYQYNYRNQLTEARLKSTNSELARLVYDATGRLAAIREGAQTLHFINDGLNVVEEYTAAGVARQYVYPGGIDRRCQIVAAGREWWFHCDVLGSTRWLSDSLGQVAANAAFAYDAFGNATAGISHENQYLFAGRRLLRPAGIYDMRARQYSPRLGRFLQRDPKGFVDGPNLYLYAGNNPVTMVDLMGTQKGTVDSEEPKPSADEYFKGHAPSVEQHAQIGGLIRALLYLNPSSMGSEEMMRKTEEVADRLLPFAYDPKDIARAKHHEQMWAQLFTVMLNMWQFAETGGAATVRSIPQRATAGRVLLRPQAVAAVMGREASRAAEAAPSVLVAVSKQRPTVNFTYTAAMAADPTVANTMRFLMEWLQEGGQSLFRGVRRVNDAAMRSLSRKQLTAEGIDLTNLDAMHLIDSGADPLPYLEGNRRAVYLFGSSRTNQAFGGQMAKEFKRLGIGVGDEFNVSFTGFPSYTDAPPSFRNVPMWFGP